MADTDSLDCVVISSDNDDNNSDEGGKWDLSVFLLLQNVKLCLWNVVGIKCLTIFIVGFYHAFLFHEYSEEEMEKECHRVKYRKR